MRVPLALVAGAVLLAGSAVAGCTAGASNDAEPLASVAGGTLVYFAADKINTLDPQRVYSSREITNLGRTVYRSLVSYPIGKDRQGAQTPIADLATDTGTETDGGRTWTFTLKEGVTWQDGKPVTCQDLRYGASRVFATDVITSGPSYFLTYLDIPIDPKTGLPAYTGPYLRQGQDLFDKAVTCDRSTITYHFKRPWPDFPEAIASTHLADPFRQDQDHGDGSRLQIFSDGPYQLDGAWSENGGGTLVRNKYYDPATDSKQLRQALPDQIKFELGVTVESQYDRLLADRGADRYAITGNSAPPSVYRVITGTAAARTSRSVSPFVAYLAPHFRTAAMRNPAIRQALSLSTNAEACLTGMGGELAGTVAESIVNPSVAGYQPNPAFAGRNFGDPDAAQRLLAEAGVRTPVPITFSYSSSDAADKCAAALQETWNDAGFKVTLDPRGGGVFDEAKQDPRKDSDVLMDGWGADWPSAMTVTPPLFDSRVNLSKGSDGQDIGAYTSPTFNALVDQARDATTLATQTAALQRADLQLGDDVAYIPLFIQRFVLTHGSKVSGYTTSAASSGFPDLGSIGVAR